MVVVACAISVSAQANGLSRSNDASSQSQSPAPPAEPALRPSVRIYLVTGGFTLADEASETADGVWYKRGNVTTFIEKERVKNIQTQPIVEIETKPIKRAARWRITDADRIQKFYLSKFNRPLPLSALGQSELHTRWGLDHRNGMDVGLHPDSVEGRTLINFLRDQEIPFLVFRGPVPRVATGPHIHIGNASSRTSVR